MSFDPSADVYPNRALEAFDDKVMWGKDETDGQHAHAHQRIRELLCLHLNTYHQNDPVLIGVPSNGTLAEFEAAHAAIHGWETYEIHETFGLISAGTRVTNKIGREHF